MGGPDGGGSNTAATANAERDARRFVLILALVALLFRLLWMSFVVRTVESEGSYYARLGENLAHGRGYLGIREQGAQLLYPPLYPLLIAGGNAVGLRSELVGRLISAFAGAAFVLVAFGLARRLYSLRVARMAAVLAALHPLLVAFGAAVLTEMLCLAVTWAGVLFVMRTRDTGRLRNAALAGLLFGFSYLSRPEAMLVVPIAMLWLVVFGRSGRLRAARQALVVLGTFAVMAAPYVAFLYVQTGELRMEAKTHEGRHTSKMVADGVALAEMDRGVDPDLTERGGSMRSNLSLMKEAHYPARDLLAASLRTMKMKTPEVLSTLGGALYFGSPILIALAVLGAFAVPWDRQRLAGEVLVIAVSCPSLVTAVTWPFWHDRFLFPLTTLLLLWASGGLVAIADWLEATLQRVNAGPRAIARAGWIATTGALVVVIAVALVGVRSMDELDDGWNPALAGAKNVGLTLRKLSPAPHRIADVGPTVAFYSGAALTFIPHCSPPVALRYLASKGVDTIVLRTSRVSEPWLNDWIRDQIPDPRAHLEARIHERDGDYIVYRFDGDAVQSP
jgi:4-amino-4-deoxy-L-arabinose transferase-like glycosyltransferase